MYDVLSINIKVDDLDLDLYVSYSLFYLCCRWGHNVSQACLFPSQVNELTYEVSCLKKNTGPGWEDELSDMYGGETTQKKSGNSSARQRSAVELQRETIRKLERDRKEIQEV